MKTIKDWRGKNHFLSEERYMIVGQDSGENFGNYTNGTVVRLISGVDNSPIVGYHFDKSYLTTCRTDASIAEFVGIRKNCLERI